MIAAVNVELPRKVARGGGFVEKAAGDFGVRLLPLLLTGTR